jgi:divalent metal cation (Fe/Co/Zn/Cd) transporter
MEAIEKIVHTVRETGEHSLDINALLITLGVLVVAIILECFSLREAMKEVKEEQHKAGTSYSFFRFYRETKNSSLIVIITEDVTALLGLGLALVGVLLTLFTGNLLWDAIGGMMIGILLVVAAIFLGKEIASLMLGEALSEEQVQRIVAVVNGHPSVSRCSQVKTQVYGTTSLLIEMDVVFVPEVDVVSAVAEIKSDVKALWSDGDMHVSTCIEPVRS